MADLKNTTAIAITCLLAIGCSSSPLSWPDSPLYAVPAFEGDIGFGGDHDAATKAIAGHYAHYDVVAYEDLTTKTPMRTFIISYGFTDFYIEDGRLYQVDKFCHAEHKINQKSVRSFFSDDAVQAIEPRVQKVDLFFKDGQWNIYRPPSPVLLGIRGDPALPLSRDPADPNLIDPDGDGNPGVTVELSIAGLFKGKLFITRREIYSNHLALFADGSLRGHVEDSSEQFVIDATLNILKQKSNALQVHDPGLNPVILLPLPERISSCDELMALRDAYFPPEPEF